MAEDFTGSDSDTDLLADVDIIARLVAMKKHRDDPLHHIEGDTDVDETYEADEEEEEEEEEKAPEEEEEEGSSIGGSKRKGPTTRPHSSLDEIIEEDWFPSSDEESNPGDLSEEDNDGAQKPCVKLPADRKSRTKKKKPRLWYDEQRENPEEQFMKKLCFLDVTQFRRALLNFHIS